MNWWKSHFCFSIALDAHEIIFGIPNVSNENIINQYNYIILYTKYYIYTHKKASKPLDLYELLVNIKQEFNFKREIFINQNRQSSFSKRWKELSDIFID